MEQIEFEPLVSQPTAPTPPPPPRSRLGGLAVGVAVAATLAMGLTAAARPDRPAPPVEQPAAAQPASVLPEPPATVEPTTAPRPTRFDAAYSSCMSEVGGSPDAREHWVASCRREADQILHDDRIYAACMSESGGAADSMERHAADCQEAIGAETP